MHLPTPLLLSQALCPVPRGCLLFTSLPCAGESARAPGSGQAGTLVCLHFSACVFLCEMALLGQEEAGCLLNSHKGCSTTAQLTLCSIFLAGRKGQGQKGAYKSRQISSRVHKHQSHKHPCPWRTLRETKAGEEQKHSWARSSRH